MPKSPLHSEQSFFSFNSMSAYLKEIDKIPLLTREEEESLTERYGTCCQEILKNDATHQLCDCCKKIKEQLIVSNLRFVVSVAKKYQNNNLSLSDLINEGNIGLVTAVDKFDYTLGYHFISYAVWWIKQSIMKAISEKSRMIRLPMNRTNELFRIAKFIDEYAKVNGQKPNEYQMEEALGIQRQEIKRILDIANGHTALEDLLTDEGELDNIRLGIIDHNNTPEQSTINQSLTENLDILMQGLPERERFILIKRFGLDGKECLSLSGVGTLLNLTKERVRQLEKQALNHIRQIAKEKEMTLYLN